MARNQSYAFVPQSGPPLQHGQGRHASQMDVQLPRIHNGAETKELRVPARVRLYQQSTPRLAVDGPWNSQALILGRGNGASRPGLGVEQPSSLGRASHGGIDLLDAALVDVNIETLGATTGPLGGAAGVGSGLYTEGSTASCLAANAQGAALPNVLDYENLLQQNMNREFSQNKLHMRKNLIAQAVGKHKPRRQRVYAEEIVKQLKEQEIRRVVDLPANAAVSATKQIARGILGTSGAHETKQQS